MGNPLFGVNISKLIKDNVGTGVLDATLTVVTNTTRLAGSLTAGRRPTEATHACKGFIDSQQVRDVNGTVHSFRKQELTGYEKVFAHSLMPEYGAALSDRDLDDVVSYLMSLRSEQ